jgi:hypothetical protein
MLLFHYTCRLAVYLDILKEIEPWWRCCFEEKEGLSSFSFDLDPAVSKAASVLPFGAIGNQPFAYARSP